MRWKPVAYCPNYEVSEEGVIKNVKLNRILGNTAKSTGGNKKYKTVTLKHGKKVFYRYVHRLVAEAFIPEYTDRSRVLFISDDYNDCSLSNIYVKRASASVEDHKDEFISDYGDKEQTCRRAQTENGKRLKYGKTQSCRFLICGVLAVEGSKHRSDFSYLFPDFSGRTVRRAVKDLIDQGKILESNGYVFLNN